MIATQPTTFIDPVTATDDWLGEALRAVARPVAGWALSAVGG